METECLNVRFSGSFPYLAMSGERNALKKYIGFIIHGGCVFGPIPEE